MTRTAPAPHPLAHYIGIDVEVHLGSQMLRGKIARVYTKPEDRDIKVVFDDPMVYGGQGAGWFTADQVSLPGQRTPLV